MSIGVRTSPIVEAYNEWDPLQEVIVGVMGGAAVPAWDLALEATMPGRNKPFFQQHAGRPWPEYTAEAAAELDGLAATLTSLGITVTRPDPLDQTRGFSTPNWSSPGGLYSAMPRDLLLVIGDLLIEAPLSWRSRYFEIDAYRSLLTEYFRQGARWVSAPRPRLLDSGYEPGFDPKTPYLTGKYVIREQEPTFDAADFIRCGRDIFAQRSHVTNQLGIDWLARTLGEDYRIHVLEVADSSPMHIDASFMPLAPGKLLLNPNRVKQLPDMFDSWDVRYAPEPALPAEHTLYMSSAWVSMNVLMLDPRRVVVDAGEAPLIDLLTDWGFEVVPVPFRNVMRFGGCFHCVTADIRRVGTLQSYFP